VRESVDGESSMYLVSIFSIFVVVVFLFSSLFCLLIYVNIFSKNLQYNKCCIRMKTVVHLFVRTHKKQ